MSDICSLFPPFEDLAFLSVTLSSGKPKQVLFKFQLVFFFPSLFLLKGSKVLSKKIPERNVMDNFMM